MPTADRDLPEPDRWITDDEGQRTPAWETSLFGEIQVWDEGIDIDGMFTDFPAEVTLAVTAEQVHHAGLVLLAAARWMRQTEGESDA